LANIQLEKKEQQQRYQRRLTYLMMVFGLILALSIYIYFYYRTKTNKQQIRSLELSVDLNEAQLKNQELEKVLLKNNLDASERELVSIAMDNAKRKEWTKEVMDKIDFVLGQPSEQQSDGFKSLYLQLVHQFQIQDRLSLTQANEDTIPKLFLHKLKTQFPDLTPAEIDLCVLIRLGLTGKEIAVIRNIDPESIRKAKYRLRLKMNAPDPGAFLALISSL
jgi:hypothetical protein